MIDLSNVLLSWCKNNIWKLSLNLIIHVETTLSYTTHLNIIEDQVYPLMMIVYCTGIFNRTMHVALLYGNGFRDMKKPSLLPGHQTNSPDLSLIEYL